MFLKPLTVYNTKIITCTGKSLSEVLIYLSINPQYDNRLFNELRVQYEKIPSWQHVLYKVCFECKNKKYDNLTQVSII